MRIEIKPGIEPEKTVQLSVYGSGGDQKQPVDHLYFSVSIRRTAALKLALALKDATEISQTQEVTI